MQTIHLPFLLGGHGSTASYRRYIDTRIAELCAEGRRGKVGSHQQPIPYRDINIGANADQAQGIHHRLSWRVLSGQRAMSRVRLGLLRLSHLNGKASEARYQQCIFCEQRLLSPYLHTFASCVFWANQRTAFWQRASVAQPESNRDALLGVVRSRPGWRQYEACISWVAELSSKEQKYWQQNIQHCDCVLTTC